VPAARELTSKLQSRWITPKHAVSALRQGWSHGKFRARGAIFRRASICGLMVRFHRGSPPLTSFGLVSPRCSRQVAVGRGPRRTCSIPSRLWDVTLCSRNQATRCDGRDLGSGVGVSSVSFGTLHNSSQSRQRK